MYKYLILFLAIALLSVVIFFTRNTAAGDRDLLALKAQNPAWAQWVDDIIRIKSAPPAEENNVKWYLELGLAWKSLADRTQNIEHYRQALKVYEAGIDFSRRTNTVLLNNAGNMAIYTKDYGQARQYYEEAMRVAPGDPEAYIRLVDLHIDYLKSDQQTIMAILDNGISRMPDPGFLAKKKEAYLKSLK